MMIEVKILEYLVESLGTDDVYMEEPKDKVSPMVVIEKTSSGFSDQVSTAVFAIKSYHDSLYEAATLSNSVKTAMLNAADNIVNISKVSLNSEYNYTDVSTKRYRYQAVFDVVYLED